MKIKCLVYPLITIIYWIFSATYRLVDDIIMMGYDYEDDPNESGDREERELKGNEALHFTVQFFLVVYIL